jgi:hypothetical protein
VNVPFLCQVDDLPDQWFGFVFEQLLCQQRGVVSAAGGSPRGDQFYIYYLRLTTLRPECVLLNPAGEKLGSNG